MQALFFPPEQPGGVSSMVPYVSERFAPLGWKTDLFWLPKRLRNKGQRAYEWNVVSINEAIHTPIVRKYVQTLRDYLWWASMRIRHRPDVIHAHHPIAALALRQLFPHTPLLMTLHSSYETELRLHGRIEAGGIEERFLVDVYRELEHCVDQLLTVSSFFKQYISQFVSFGDRISVVSNGFDEARFTPVDHDNATVQLVTMCRLVPAKGLDVLLAACIALKQRGIRFVLHVIGDGPMRIGLEQQAQSGGIGDDVIFYGYVLHPEQFMPFFDVFVLPSRAEAFGNVFAEAALCGLARVGTAIGGIVEQICHRVDGELIGVDDVEALVASLSRLIRDRAYRQQIARAGTARARGAYSVDRVVHALDGVYREVRAKKEAERAK
jgi:glycosyltransferase involved in cell wall biosynthesis